VAGHLCGCGFAAIAPLAMEHRRLEGRKRQIQGQAVAGGAEMMLVSLRFDPPIVHPDLEAVRGRGRQAHGAPLGLFPEEENPLMGVAHGQVGEIDGVGPPGRSR